MCIIYRLFVSRSPDDAKIKSKMVYASSKDALRRSLVGVATEIQGTALDEVAYESGTFYYLLSVCLHADQRHSP